MPPGIINEFYCGPPQKTTNVTTYCVLQPALSLPRDASTQKQISNKNTQNTTKKRNQRILQTGKHITTLLLFLFFCYCAVCCDASRWLSFIIGDACGNGDSAAGLVKSILVMIGTPLVAKYIGLNNPQSAMVFGGLMGTTSGVAAGLAATDPKLVPYGAMTATFYTGVGCLLGPSILFFIVSAIY